MLAQSYLNQKNFNSAAKELTALLEYFPDDVDAKLQLGNIYLVGGLRDLKLFRQAAEIAQSVLSKEPANVSALILLGNAEAGLQDYRSSVESFEKAIPLDPQNTGAFVSLGTTQALQKNYSDAEQAFLKARQLNPKDKSALIALANYYRALQMPEKAEAIWKEGLAIYPGDADIYVGAVEFYYQADRLNDVERILREAQTRDNANPRPLLQLAAIYTAKDRVADAQNLLLELETQFPNNMEVAARLAASLIESQHERAQAEIDRIIKADPKNPVGYVLLGELQFLSGKLDEAEATLGKPPAIDSAYPQAHYFLGNIVAGKGKYDEALDHYQKSLALNSRYVLSRVGLAQMLFNRERTADAKEEIRKVLAERPTLVSARLLKSSIDTAEKNYSEAEREFTALLKEQPENASVHRQMGLYYDSRGQAANAEKSLLRAVDLAPDSVEILTDLTQFYIRNKQTDRAIQKINTVPDDRKQAAHYELMGLAYSQGGKLPEAERAYKKALEKEPNRSSTGVYLVGVYLQSGRPDEGLKFLDELTSRNPNYASAYGAKGFIYQTQNKLEEAKQNYVKALKIDPNLDSAAINYAYILADQGQDLTTALEWAQMGRRKQPQSADAAGTLGWVQYKLGSYVPARDQLQFAVSREPDNPEFQYHLGMVYKETKQISEAQAALRKAISSPKEAKEKALAQQALKEIAGVR